MRALVRDAGFDDIGAMRRWWDDDRGLRERLPVASIAPSPHH
jgi:hypothetical protein